MARRKKDDGTEALVIMLTIFTVGAFLLIKWAIEFIVWVVKGIISLCSKKEKQKQVNNIINNSFENAQIKPIEDVDSRNIKEKLGLFDKSIYNDMFEIQIRRRGETYFSEKKIKNVRHNGNKYTCQADGTDTYNVSITFDENNNIVDTDCDCPYFKDKKDNCKHIYALLLKAKCEENPLKIIEEINNYYNNIDEMIEKATNYISNNKLVISEYNQRELNNTIDSFGKKLERYKSDLTKYQRDEETLLRILESLIEDSAKLQEQIKKILNSSSSTSSTTKTSVSTNKENKVSLGDVAAGLFLANEIDNHFNKDNDEDYDEDLEKEMDAYALEDWQKDLVRKGEYDPWNFEEDGELEEDDYYYEDD